MDMIHTLGLMLEYGRQYNDRDFLSITRTMRTAVMVVSCALHYIPSQSSCNHEFLLVESCSVEGESVMLIIKRAPSNGGI